MKERLRKIKQKYLEKGKYTKTKIVISIIISLLISTILVVMMPTKIWDRFPIFSIVIFFILLHLIFKVNKIYEFIYKYRYAIAAVVLVYIVVMEYSGSSIGCYNKLYQTENTSIYYTPILGDSREIRTDEWNVNTPIAISQSFSEKGFSYYNDLLRGTSTDMFSIVSAPVLDILLIAKPFNIGYILFGAARGLSFVWYGKIIAMMLVSFEFFMILTDKKKLLSMFGMILILFSASTQWWNLTELVTFGLLVLVLIDKFLITKKYKTKLLCALGIFVSAVAYAFILYPTWQIPYGYIYIGLLIWILWKNRKQYKINWKDVLIVLTVIIAIGAIGLRYFNLSKETLTAEMSTDYPGKRFELGGHGESSLFSYVYSFLYPYQDKEMVNPCEPSGMTSLYPIPMILAIIFLIRNKDRKQHLAFLIPMLLLGTLLSIWSLTSTTPFLAKITLLYMVPGSRASVPLGLIQIILMIYLMAHIKQDDKVLDKNLALVVSAVLSILILSIAIQTDSENVMGELKSYICGLLLFGEIYSLLTINKESSKKLLITLLIPISLIGGATVNPIQKGISVITEKPVSKKIQEIVHTDSQNNMWLAESFPDYALANGARVANSLNTYPNFEFYEKLLGKEKCEKQEVKKIFNRYAHVMFDLTTENTDISLLGQDAVILHINPNSLKELEIKYMLMMNPIDKKYNINGVEFEEIYNEMNTYIYKVNY